MTHEKSILQALAGTMRPYNDDLIAFAQRLIQTPSYPGEEGKAAELVRAEMTRLAYDDVHVDAVGNIVGLVRGARSERCLMLNAHLDHVSVGNEAAWAHPPFSGAIVDGELWGRATVDLKGSVASMVYALGGLKRQGIVPPWDVYVCAVVCEETGGIGTMELLRSLHPQFCVIGEASRNQLSLGHRGVQGMFVEFTGRAAHASMVNVGINPHYAAARFLLGLSGLAHASDPMLGPSSAAPTLYNTDQTSSNVIPGMVRIYLDWRSVPQEDTEWITGQVERLVKASLEPGVSGSVTPRQFPVRTYTGMDFMSPLTVRAVRLDPQSELATHSHQVLEMALGRTVEKMVWRFCTDGAHCAAAGVPIIGFGPGDPELAHTSAERVVVADLQEAMLGNAALALSPAGSGVTG